MRKKEREGRFKSALLHFVNDALFGGTLTLFGTVSPLLVVERDSRTVFLGDF